MVKRTRSNKKRTVRGTKRRYVGGVAPLNYTMGPGANVGVYGRFPTEVGADPFSVKDLDVYYRSALSRGCGLEDSGRTVPADMGSNAVVGQSSGQTGGASSLESSALDSTMTKISDLFGTVGNRPYVSTVAPNMAQSLANSWSGNPQAVPASASPEVPTWSFRGASTAAINPERVVTAMPPTGTYLAKGWNFTQSQTGAGKKHRNSRRRRTMRNKHKRTHTRKH
jgi:hypothetical protein